MSYEQVLEQLLSAGKQALDKSVTEGKALGQQGMDKASDLLDIPESGEERQEALQNMGKGAAAVGALALMLGTSGGRKLTGGLLKLGSVAAIGTVAYQAYQNYQNNEAGSDEPATIDALARPSSDAKILVLAMLAAANADGHINETELEIILKQVKSMGAESAIQDDMAAAIKQGVGAKEIAEMVNGEDQAREVYLLSRLVVDPSKPTDKQYLDDLAAALNIDAAIADELNRFA